MLLPYLTGYIFYNNIGVDETIREEDHGTSIEDHNNEEEDAFLDLDGAEMEMCPDYWDKNTNNDCNVIETENVTLGVQYEPMAPNSKTYMGETSSPLVTISIVDVDGSSTGSTADHNDLGIGNTCSNPIDVAAHETIEAGLLT